MIYNLEKNLSNDVIANGVYESLTSPKRFKELSDYINYINKEITDCPYIHCPDYDLLVPINDNIANTIVDICSEWWKDEN